MNVASIAKPVPVPNGELESPFQVSTAKLLSCHFKRRPSKHTVIIRVCSYVSYVYHFLRWLPMRKIGFCFLDLTDK